MHASKLLSSYAIWHPAGKVYSKLAQQEGTSQASTIAAGWQSGNPVPVYVGINSYI